MKTYKLAFTLDGYLVEVREIEASSLNEAKRKLRKLCGSRKVTNIKQE